MHNVLFGLAAIAPPFFLIALGIFLRKVRLMETAVIDQFSQLVFYVFLPALLFNTVSQAEISSLLTGRLLLAAWGTLFAGAILARIIAVAVKTDSPGLFVSGAIWSNVAIIGFSLNDAIYGQEGMARAAILSCLLLPMHFILGVSCMSLDKNQQTPGAGIKKICRQLSTNPVIIATILGAIASILPFSMPPFIVNITMTLGRASLPLALISIGASLSFSSGYSRKKEVLLVIFTKLTLLPLIGFVLARILTMNPAWTGSIILAFASPTAVSFFVVARSVGYSASRGALIITFGTLGAALSTGIIIALLHWGGLA